MMQPYEYRSAREKMRTGDVIAFANKGWLGRLISWSTFGPVTHVGMVVTLRPESNGHVLDHRVVQVADSTSLEGRKGTGLGLLSQRIREHKGPVWWLPLADEVREQFNTTACLQWLRKHEEARYDFWQAVRAGVGDKLPIPQFVLRSYRRLYCSELAAGGLQAGSALPAKLNPARETPMELVRRHIYSPEYYLLAGPQVMIPGFNSVSLAA